MSKYIGGIIGLTKDALRLTVFLLKRPHYVAVLLAVIIGLFYINGVPPREIGGFLKDKWQTFAENRKQVFKEEYQTLSARFSDKKLISGKTEEELPPEIAELMEIGPQNPSLPADFDNGPSREETEARMKEETFGWQQAFREVREEQNDFSREDEDTVEGVLSVIGADRVNVDGKEFRLKVRLLSGKAGTAYQYMKKQFDGMYAQCFPDKDFPERAECIVGSRDVAESLQDMGMADPI